MRDVPSELSLRAGTTWLHKARHNTVSTEKKRDLYLSLLRYQIRKTTRCTPLGAFAAVGFATWGPATKIHMASDRLRYHPRLSEELLCDIVKESYAAEKNADGILLVTNSSLLLTDRKAVFTTSSGSRSLVALTPKILLALGAAIDGIRLNTLVRVVQQNDADGTEAFRLISELLAHDLLIHQTWAPLGEDPTGFASRSIRDSDTLPNAIRSVDELCRQTPRNGIYTLGAAYSALDRQFEGRSKESGLMVDTRLQFRAARIGPTVRSAAERAATILAKLSPFPDGPPELVEYRARFLEKYGTRREVPLLEALDDYHGIGAYPPLTTGSKTPGQGVRDAILGELANRDPRRGVEVKLSTDIIEKIAVPSARFATTLELCFQLAATSAAAIDAGDFRLVISPNVGSPEVGRHFGRFSHLMTRSEVRALRSMVRFESAAASETEQPIFAELWFAPTRPRHLNLVRRTLLHDYVIAVSSTTGTKALKIYPADLRLSVHDGRFILTSVSLKRQVVVASTHMLRSDAEPPLVRLLHALARDGTSTVSGFSWGGAANKAFLPRVVFGKIVLALAQWRLPSQLLLNLPEAELKTTVGRWRRDVAAPELMALSFADNFLVLNLENRDHRRILQQEAMTVGTGDLVLREVLPALDDAWVTGRDGRFASEYVVGLALNELVGKSPLEKRHLLHQSVTQPERLSRVSATPALPIGDGWLYFRLYCTPDNQDDLLCEVAAFLNGTLASIESSGWFFVRYHDGAHHLRLRVKGCRDWLVGTLMPSVMAWASDLMSSGRVTSYSIDSYEREVERYGGAESLEAIEDYFCAESRVVCDLLASESDAENELSRPELTAGCFHSLVQGFDVPVGTMHSNLSSTLGRRAGKLLTDRRARLEVWAGLLQRKLFPSRKAEIAFRRLDVAAHALADRLRELEVLGRIDVRPDQLIPDLTHMTANRMLGIARDEEDQARAILWRTYGFLENHKL